MHLITVLLLVAATWLPTSSVALDTPDNGARLERALSALQSLEGGFEQKLFDEYGELIETSTGVVSIAKPGRFRWEYQAPYEQIIVTNGETLWVYDVDLEQVSVNAMEAGAGSPAELLVGDVDLDAYYDIAETPGDGNQVWVALSPKSTDGQYAAIEIAIAEDQIAAMKLRDNLNQLTWITFDNVRRNQTIDESRFEFVPPPGVDVVHSAAN